MPDDDDFEDPLLEDGPAMPEDIDEEDLDLEAEELGEDDLDDADLDTSEAEQSDVEEVGAEGDVLVSTDEEDEYEEEDEEDSDDVEASLDVILKSRLVVSGDEEEDEQEQEGEEETDVDDRGETTTRVLPKQPGEFVCQSCFLVKHQSQLADRERGLCRDCV
ncbi:MAG: DUF4193 family protein [Acidimicrobiales bacterium]